MRLTCPNCGAQYEVPDDVIPEEGRDVQCSNCGDTWFQHAAGFDPGAAAAAQDSAPDAASPAAQPSAETAPETDTESAEETAPRQEAEIEIGTAPDGEFATSDASGEASFAHEDTEANAASDAVDAHTDAPEDTLAETQADTHDDQQGSRSEPAAPQQRGLDPALSGILREEAEREASLRAAAPPQGLETQPGLGLDDVPEDENARRTRQAKDRMARIRGEDPRRLAAEASGLKRGVLPDIEEINSTLRANDTAPMPTAGPALPAPRKSGFTRGFALAVLVIVAMVMVYSNAPQIAEQIPQADPYLSSYVTWVDQARLWLDTQVKALQAPQV